ncbi:MAG: hypothetical protein WAM73_16725 [Desulfobacterales bacterium]
MKYRYLGSSGLLMTRLTLGTMTFGVPDWGCDEKESQTIIKNPVSTRAFISIRYGNGPFSASSSK